MPQVDDTIGEITRRVADVVRAERTARGMSLGELARVSGLSKSLLARLEAQGGNPSLDTLWRLSRALALPLGALIDEPGTPRVRTIPARSAQQLDSDDGMHAWLVHAEGRAHRSELFEIAMPAGLDRRSEAHMPATEELVLCVSGRVRVGPEGHEAERGPGDAAVFAADVAHRYSARRASRILNWIIYPS